MTIPTDLEEGASETEKILWLKKVERYVKRQVILESTLKTLYTFVWGEKTDYLKAKLKSTQSYLDIKRDYDALSLIKETKAVSFKFDDQMYLEHSIFMAYMNFYQFRQLPEIDNTTFLDRFNNIVDIVEQYKGSYAIDATNTEIKAAKARTRDKFLAYALINKADNTRHCKFKEELENDYTKGDNNYLKTVTATYHLLNN